MEILVRTIRIVIFQLLLLLSALPAALAQSVTGQISGTTVDPGGSVIAGATVQLSNDLTRQVRSFTTESNGSFIFTDLVPGDYSVHIAFPGFKSYDQKAINVSSQEKVALHDIRLEVGDVSSTVTVQADSARVSTDSSDRSVLVNATQIENTPIPGRDFMGLMQSLPGVVDLNAHDVPGNNSGMPTINGGQSEKLNISLDGIKSQESGNATYSGNLAPSMDAVAEVRVMVSSYSAEYGGRAGGQMSLSIKNGTNQFHGSSYFFFRNEFLNANAYFNNQAGLARPFYRYNNPGGTFGGPLLIPGTRFNKSRTKLFFFFLGRLSPVLDSRQSGQADHAHVSGTEWRLFANRHHHRQADSRQGPDERATVSGQHHARQPDLAGGGLRCSICSLSRPCRT